MDHKHSKARSTMVDLENLNIQLSQEEQNLLQGVHGSTLQKIMKTLVLYGEALGAERLVDIEGDGHFVISWAIPGIAPSLEMLDELISVDLQTKFPFTLDPKAPLDFENLGLRPDQEHAITRLFKDQAYYDEQMLKLGLRSEDAYTCNPYQPEIGNIPRRGAILAWSESACAIFANSVLAARTNRNGAILDLLSNIAGKTPYIGLVTDEGRRASWLIDVQTDQLPNPQLLGAVIGGRVIEDVPLITGLDRFLGAGLCEKSRDYLHEMGAACATYGAVGLYHVENITPEAIEQGRDLLIKDHATYVIDDQVLESHFESYPNLWMDQVAKAERCLIGCPHLSLQQLNWWAEKILQALDAHNQIQLAVVTILFAAPQVIKKFTADEETYRRLKEAGVQLSTACAETLFEGEVCSQDAIVTNSNKLRAYTTARFYPDEEILGIVLKGEIANGR
jgi:predicted aconitase